MTAPPTTLDLQADVTGAVSVFGERRKMPTNRWKHNSKWKDKDEITNAENLESIAG